MENAGFRANQIIGIGDKKTLEREQENARLARTWMILFGDFNGEKFLSESKSEINIVCTLGSIVESKENLKCLEKAREIRIAALKKHRMANGYKNPVVKINEFTGEVIEEYESVSEAARLNKMSADGVYKVCSGFMKKCKGNVFRYKKKILIHGDEIE